MAENVKNSEIQGDGKNRVFRKIALAPNKHALKPWDYPPEEKQQVCEHIIAEVAGGRSIASILREDEGMPSSGTWWTWHFNSSDLQSRVAHAREHGVEAILDEAKDIADEDDFDWEWVEDRNGAKRLKINGEAIQRSKLKVETRIKMAQMIAPRKYGPKVDITSAGEQLAAPAQHIDARVQSIVMQAAQRMALGVKPEELEGLDQEAKDLLG